MPFEFDWKIQKHLAISAVFKNCLPFSLSSPSGMLNGNALRAITSWNVRTHFSTTWDEGRKLLSRPRTHLCKFVHANSHSENMLRVSCPRGHNIASRASTLRPWCGGFVWNQCHKLLFLFATAEHRLPPIRLPSARCRWWPPTSKRPLIYSTSVTGARTGRTGYATKWRNFFSSSSRAINHREMKLESSTTCILFLFGRTDGRTDCGWIGGYLLFSIVAGRGELFVG